MLFRSIYCLSGGLDIIGNEFRDTYDEAIVCSGKDITIDSNKFINVPNKSIATAYDGVKNLIVTNNLFKITDPTKVGAQVLKKRTEAVNIDYNVKFNHNIIEGYDCYACIQMNLFDTLEIKDNIFDLPISGSDKAISCTGTNNGLDVSNNVFKSSTGVLTSPIVDISGTYTKDRKRVV